MAAPNISADVIGLFAKTCYEKHLEDQKTFSELKPELNKLEFKEYTCEELDNLLKSLESALEVIECRTQDDVRYKDLLNLAIQKVGKMKILQISMNSQENNYDTDPRLFTENQTLVVQPSDATDNDSTSNGQEWR